MISCDVIQDLLPLYADGQASNASKQLIEEHIKHCEGCRAMMYAMCTPIEQQSCEDINYINALKKQKRKNRNRIILACVLTILLCVLGWWLYMELRFTLETPALISNSQEKILGEMPLLALTQSEKNFAEEMKETPILREALESDQIQVVPLEMIEDDVSAILPENAVLVEVASTQNTVSICYMLNDMSFSLVYLDPNHDGTVDAIDKTIGDGNFSGKGADTVYGLRYIPVLDSTQYEKYVRKHIWFGFLKMQ